MEHLYCRCLNVIINVKSSANRSLHGRDLLDVSQDQDDDDFEIDEFFADEIYEVELGFSGIELEQKLLLKERCCGDWIVTICSNCGMDTHAVHSIKGLDRVLVSKHLQNDGVKLKEMKKTPLYSPVFKILLEPMSDARPNSPASPRRSKSVFEATQIIENLVRKYLKIQEEEMNERIRVYTEQQLTAFRDVKLKANNDKDRMLTAVCYQDESHMNDSLLDAINDSYFDNPSSEKRDAATDLPNFKGSRVRTSSSLSETDGNFGGRGGQYLAQSLPSRVLPIRHVPVDVTRKPNLSHQLSPPTIRTKSHSDDAMFDLDGFHDSKSYEPFFESDDESSGDAGSLESSGGYAIPGRNIPVTTTSSNRVYATSVPVSIPCFAVRQSSYEEPAADIEEENEPTPSPQHMAESIKQLARSIQDSTSMFGELPRPRLYTMPYSYR